MAKLVPDAQLDAMLLKLIENTDRIDVCSSGVTSYSLATTGGTNSLGNTTVTAGIGADWSAGAGDTSGRKVTLAEQTGVSVTNSGSAGDIAGTDGTSVLYFVTTCTAQTVTAGNTMTIQTFDIELQDAA